jgi:hypothetical protein
MTKRRFVVRFSGEALTDLLVGIAPNAMVAGMPADSKFLYCFQDDWRDMVALVFETTDPSIPVTHEGDPYYQLQLFTTYDNKARSV